MIRGRPFFRVNCDMTVLFSCETRFGYYAVNSEWPLLWKFLSNKLF